MSDTCPPSSILKGPHLPSLVVSGGEHGIVILINPLALVRAYVLGLWDSVALWKLTMVGCVGLGDTDDCSLSTDALAEGGLSVSLSAVRSSHVSSTSSTVSCPSKRRCPMPVVPPTCFLRHRSLPVSGPNLRSI